MTDGHTRRLLDVTAYTTLDYVPAEVEGHDWADEAVGVVDVEICEDDVTGAPEGVQLALELDGADVDRLPRHAVRLDLSAEAARTLATELTSRAAEVAES